MQKNKIFGARPLLFFGENSFEIAREINKNKILAEKNGFFVEQIDGETLTFESLIDAVSGLSLFGDNRLVIIKNLSRNTEVWRKILEIFPRITDVVVVILVEDKFDRRTKFNKQILEKVDYKEFKTQAGDRNYLINLARIIAKNLELPLSDQQAGVIIDQVGTNEWSIKHAIERLALIPPVTVEKIQQYLTQNQEINSFRILELAINRQSELISAEIEILKNSGTDEAYKLFGLFSTQIFNLLALKIGANEGLTSVEIAKKIGVNAWALNQLKNLQQKINLSELEAIVNDFIEADEILKTTNVDIWEIITSLLLKIATRPV